MHCRIRSPKAFHENVTGLTHVFQSFTDEEIVVGQTLTHNNLPAHVLSLSLMSDSL